MVLKSSFVSLAGQSNTFRVSGAIPGERVYFVWGLIPGSTNVPGCPGMTFDIANLSMSNMFGFDEADAEGNASVTAFVPPAASGFTVLFQAVEITNCIVSNRIDYTFP